MTNNYMNSSLSMAADLCGIKTDFVAGSVNGSLMFATEVKVTKGSLETLLQLVGERTREKAGPYIKLLNDFELAAKVTYHNQRTMISVDSEGLHFLAYDGLQGKFVAFTILPDELENSSDALSQTVKGVTSIFGIKKFCFIYRNTNITSSDLYQNFPTLPDIPAMIEGDVLLSTSFRFENIAESTFSKAMNAIFGVGGMDIIIGIRKSQVECMLLIPDLENRLLKCQNVAIYSKFGNAGVLLRMSGIIGLMCLPGLSFYVNSEFNMTSVSLSASSIPGNVYQIPKTMLSICNCGLEIGFNGVDINLAAMTQINIRQLMWYGALSMSINATGIPMLDMISMAMSEVSISSLVTNLVGIDSEGIQALDIFAIKPFDTNYKGKLDFTKLSDEEIISEINSILPNTHKLNKGTTSITRLPNNRACDVLDTNTMFHYWIDTNKQLSFPPQAYYAAKHITIGAYKFEQGIFFAGKMVLFDKSIKVMFSAVKDKGLLAYAQIDAIENRIIRISGSKSVLTKVNPVLGNAKNSTLDLLVTNYHTDKEISNPVILYMDLSRNSCSFYIDGHVELCKLFSFDAMVYFASRRIKLAVETTYFNMIKSSLYLDVDYQNFTKLAFAFQIMLDCTGLQNNLRKLSGLLDTAVKNYDQKINQAKRKLDDAKQKVKSLQREINSFKQKIEHSKEVIRKTSKIRVYKIAAEGLKIAAYETAIAGINIAMKTASAALDVASRTLTAANKLGSGFLNAINAVVQGVLNVFYISRAMLGFMVNGSQVLVKTDLSLTILGKEVTVDNTISLDKLVKNPIGLLEELVIDSIKDILDSLKMGNLPEYDEIDAEPYPYMTLPEDISELSEYVAYGVKRVEQSKGMLEELQDLYLEDLHEAEPDFSDVETEFKETIEMISYSMHKATENMYSLGMDELMAEIDSANDEGKLTEAEYVELHGCVSEYVGEIRPAFSTLNESCQRINELSQNVEVGRFARKVSSMRQNNEHVNGAVILEKRDYDKFYGEVQAVAEKYFPRGSGHGYFNITDEDFFYETLNRERRDSGCAYVETPSDIENGTNSMFVREPYIISGNPEYKQRLK